MAVKPLYFRTFSAVIFGAMALGQATSFAPNFQKGAAAAGYIKGLDDSNPDIDAYATEGEKPVSLPIDVVCVRRCTANTV